MAGSGVVGELNDVAYANGLVIHTTRSEIEMIFSVTPISNIATRIRESRSSCALAPMNHRS